MHPLGLDYFHAFEDDLQHMSRYVQFAPDNYKTYSLELVRLLLAAGSEVDVALKELCSKIDAGKKPENICEYKKIILPEFKDILSQPVTIRRFEIKIVPWEDWDKSPPAWWRAYNKVKHSRQAHYREGNFKNVLFAVAGLGVIMQYLGSRAAENFRGSFFSNLRSHCLPWNE